MGLAHGQAALGIGEALFLNEQILFPLGDAPCPVRFDVGLDVLLEVVRRMHEVLLQRTRYLEVLFFAAAPEELGEHLVRDLGAEAPGDLVQVLSDEGGIAHSAQWYRQRVHSMAFNLAPRVLLYPFGSAAPAVEPGWLALAQRPPQAGATFVFGDGSHATTRLCAAALDLLCRQREPQAVLDVGTGTGVLARIARARGARFVAATDLDAAALACARDHAELDASCAVIHFRRRVPDDWGSCFDLVVANILEQPLRELAVALRASLRPGGVLLLSGFMRSQTPGLRLLYEQTGLRLTSESHLEEWALLRFHH
jgi:Ribosomal protein L11 methyltransferase (PrmA)